MDDFDPDLFWDQVRGTGDCWVWTGYRTPNGYGNVAGFPFTERYAHRLSWTMANGPIPAGMWVLHHCDNPPCVNPEHLYIGTAADNAQDRERRGRSNHPTGSRPGYVQKVRTHCRQGHELADNVLVFADGWRRCRTCYAARLATKVYPRHAAAVA